MRSPWDALKLNVYMLRYLVHIHVYTANFFEILWTVITIYGIAYCYQNRRDTINDIELLKEPDTQIIMRWSHVTFVNAKIYARSAYRHETGRLFSNVVFFAVGAIACLTPEPVEVQNEAINVIADLRSVAFALIFISAVAGLTWASREDRNARKLIMDNIIQDRERGDDVHAAIFGQQ